MAYIITESYESSDKKNSLFEKLIAIRRSAKVTKGGRIFGFSAITVVGDRKGKVGIGRGKAKEVPSAIQKSIENAKHNFVLIKINNGTIFHKISVKYCATRLVILPASEGTGIIAPHIMRSVFEAIGIKNILTKCIGSRNPNNVINCAIKGLLEMTKNIEANAIRHPKLKSI